MIYAYVRNTRCITADYRLPDSSEDPLVIRSGSRCDTGRVNDLKSTLKKSSFINLHNNYFNSSLKFQFISSDI